MKSITPARAVHAQFLRVDARRGDASRWAEQFDAPQPRLFETIFLPSPETTEPTDPAPVDGVSPRPLSLREALPREESGADTVPASPPPRGQVTELTWEDWTLAVANDSRKR
jgi:hypothetical protein